MSGDQERADAHYSEALALWRGPPLANVAFESFARSEVERLEEERLDALTDRIDCELALGRHHELTSELESLVKQYPLRERLRAQLMLAFYRSGRQADALVAYQNARRTLVEELGLEPGRELHDLQQAILRHDATLEAPAQPGRRRHEPRRGLVAALPAVGIAAVSRGGVVVRISLGAPMLQRRSHLMPSASSTRSRTESSERFQWGFPRKQ